MDNPLFPIAKAKHLEDVRSGDYDFLINALNNQSCYTLGFCRGVAHASDIFSKQIELLQKQVKELSQIKS